MLEAVLASADEEMFNSFVPETKEIEPEAVRVLNLKSTPVFPIKRPWPDPEFVAVLISPVGMVEEITIVPRAPDETVVAPEPTRVLNLKLTPCLSSQTPSPVPVLEAVLASADEEMFNSFAPETKEIEPEAVRVLNLKSTPALPTKRPCPDPVFEAVLISPVGMVEEMTIVPRAPEAIVVFPEPTRVLNLNP